MRNEASFPRPVAAPHGGVFAPLRGLVQTGSFFGKEFAEVRRQPKLILSLIAAPFLLLFLFGLGYSPQPPKVRTLVVVPPDSQYQAEIEKRKDAFGDPFVLEGITTDAADARRRLENREVQALIFFPKDPYQQIINSQYAPLDLEFNEIDPTRAQWISYYGYVQTNELNKRLLVEALKQQNPQQHIDTLRQSAAGVRDNAHGLQQAVTSGDPGAVAQHAAALEAENSRFQTELLTVGQLFGAVAVVGNISEPQNTTQGRDLIAAQEASARITQSLSQMRQGIASGQVGDQQRAQADSIARDADTANDAAGRLSLPSADVIVSPFEPKSHNISRLEPTFVNYYAPGVIALLAQHIAVTLTALTLVRERLRGTTEVLRVAPIGVWSIAWGKYLSHFTITALLAAGLTAALHYGLGIPILGGVQYYALALGLMIAASLSVGFFISAIASSESQAVQFSLLLLIASVLFGGFFLSLESLIPQVRVLSYALPITHGIIALQTTMLRGEFPPLWALGTLGGMAVGFFILSAVLFRRQIRQG